MALESIKDSLGLQLLDHRYRTTRVTLEISNPVHWRYVKSLALNEIWHEHVFISGNSLHLTCHFCKIELGSTQILRL
jgi:hypothetical protein